MVAANPLNYLSAQKKMTLPKFATRLLDAAAERARRILGYAPPVIMPTRDPGNAQSPWITEVPVWLARKTIDPQLLLAAVPGLVQLSGSTRRLVGNSPR